MEDKIRVLISEEDVNKRISEIAAHISKDYEGQPVHLICILKGVYSLPASWQKGLQFLYHWILCLYPVMVQVRYLAV